MSENFTGVTFAEQPVLPSEDAIVRRAALRDGILSGCTFGYSGSTLSMGPGYILICGRMIRHPSVQYWPIVDAKSGYARLVLTVDMTRASTKDTFDQVVDSVEYATSLNGFAALTQADINAAGTKYQIAACVVSLGTGGITGIVQSAPVISTAGTYAPAGYGLGESSGKLLKQLSDLDKMLLNGLYNLDIPAGAKLFNCDISKATVLVEAFSSDAARQTISPIGTHIRIERTRKDGAWGSWNIENPPMELGVEYRTTATWGGKSVYTKRIAFAASSFTSSSVALPHGISGLDICLSAETIWKRTEITDDGWRRIPSSDPDSGSLDGDIGYIGETSIKFYLGSTLRSRLVKSTEPVYVTMRYTKV